MSSLVQDAIALLQRGDVIGLPTETVYGLAADAANEAAVRRVYAIKGRPLDHPVIVHVASADAIDAWAFNNDMARALAIAFWPGPMTLVLPRRSHVGDWITGGQDTVALRVPSHPLALELLRTFGGGIAAPSANRFGHVSPTTAQHVRADLGDDVKLVLDGGACTVGVESTILDCTGRQARILRPGGVTREAIESVLGHAVELADKASDVRAPGMLASHYAPAAAIVLADAAEAHARLQEAIARGDRAEMFDASARERDSQDIAAALYATLRDADARGVQTLVVTLPEARGLGLAIRDRLLRAAAPRIRS